MEFFEQGSTPFLAACERYSNYLKLISPDKLMDQVQYIIYVYLFVLSF